MTGTSFQVVSLGDGQVRIRTDSPGERATSVDVDAVSAIDQIAQVAGLDVTITPLAEPEPAADDEQAAAEPEPPPEGEAT